MANKQQLQAMILAVLAALAVMTAVAAQLLYFSPMEKKYVVGGPEILFSEAAEPADNGLAAVKERLLKDSLYLNLQKFGDWPPDFAKIKFLQKNPFVE